MAFKLNTTPTDGRWGLPSIPPKYNVFAKKKNPVLDAITLPDAITLKVFGPPRRDRTETTTEMLYQSQIERSKGLCEQISEFIYFADWNKVEVVSGAPHFDRKRIDLDLIQIIRGTWDETADTTADKDFIMTLMNAFKQEFNSNCEKAIAELWRDDAKVWLEVTKRAREAPDPQKTTSRGAKETFEIIDRNHDQVISRIEYFKALMPNFKPRVAEKLGLGVLLGQVQESEERFAAQKQFDIIDRNSDGVLSWAEFRRVYAQRTAPDEGLWNEMLTHHYEYK